MNRKQRRTPPQGTTQPKFNPFWVWWRMERSYRGLEYARLFLEFVSKEFGEDSVECRMATNRVGEHVADIKRHVSEWNAQKDAGFVPIVNGEPNKTWRPDGGNV